MKNPTALLLACILLVMANLAVVTPSVIHPRNPAEPTTQKKQPPKHASPAPKKPPAPQKPPTTAGGESPKSCEGFQVSGWGFGAGNVMQTNKCVAITFAKGASSVATVTTVHIIDRIRGSVTEVLYS